MKGLVTRNTHVKYESNQGYDISSPGIFVTPRAYLSRLAKNWATPQRAILHRANMSRGETNQIRLKNKITEELPSHGAKKQI